ncbi:MAG: hypothetical protein KDD56_08035, partial [Bdellovibrionales bacterium]|nr:hypothetical protein [Bdellovibrionales bacterium]
GPGYISTNLAAFRDTDDILNYNSSFNSVIIQTNGETTSAVRAEGTSITIKAIDEKQGYFVAESTADFLGFNGGNLTNLFLFDRSGKAIAQITSNTGTDTYSAIDINEGGTKIVFNDSNTNSLDVIDISSYGAAPGSYSRTTVLSSSSTNLYNATAKISDDGTYVAYLKDTGSNVAVSLMDVATQTEDAYLASQTFAYGETRVGFLDTDKIAFYESASKTLKTYTDGAGAIGDTLLDLSSSGVTNTYFSFYEIDSYSEALIGVKYLGTTDNALIISDASTDNTIIDFNVQGLDLFDSDFNVIRDGSGNPLLGTTDNLVGVVGDTDVEVYTLTPSEVEENSFKRIRDYAKLFSKDHLNSLDSPGQLFKFTAKLEELMDILNENIDVVDGIREYAIQNNSFLRDLGLKILEAANKPNSGAEGAAETLASRIKNSISIAGTASLNINDINGLLAATTLLADEE